MELKNLYPLKINHISSTGRACFNFDDSQNQTWFMQILKLSIIHSFYLTDLFCVDHGRSRLEINWVLISYDCESYTRFTQLLPVGFDSNSVSWLWGNATWLEREVWEMFGVRFISHPDLRRLLTDYGFRGRPMVKNFPVIGYNQLSYSERQKRIIPVRTSLAQEFREFDFKSPWLS